MIVLIAAVLLGADDRATAVGPTLDPIRGSTALASDREWLPNTRQPANLADFWFIEPVNMQNSGGGISTFDPQYTAAHGRSRTLTGHYLNGANIGDPGRPGEPLLVLPYRGWDRLRFESLYTTSPGFHISLTPSGESGAWARASAGGQVGGPLFLPEGVFDREPAFPSGATPTVRELDRASEFEGEVNVALVTGEFRFLVERLDHTRRFPTFVSPASGEQLDDTSSRDTVMAVGRLANWPLEFTAAYQSAERSADDAQFRLPLEYTHESRSQSLLMQARTELELAVGVLDGGISFGQKSEDRNRMGDAPVVRDILDEWLWLARPRLGEESRRQRIGGWGRFRGGSDAFPYAISLRLTQGSVRTDFSDDPVTGTTHVAGQGPVSIDIFDPQQTAREWIRNGRAQLDGEWRPDGRWRFAYGIGLDFSAVGTPQGWEHSSFAPGFALNAVFESDNGSQWFFLLRREPDPLTYEQARFLSPSQPSGQRFRWNDDGDGVPELGEQGGLQSRFGGRFRTTSDELDRPTANHFAFGWRSPVFGAFQAMLTGVSRFHLDAMTARFEGPAASSFSRRVIDDPGGDGRGESRTDEGPGRTPVFDRLPGSNGQEIYALVNRDTANLYVGAELQLATVDRDWWFVNFQAKGYWNIGEATFGSFPDRNDPGVLDENSADPNQRVNERGRFDQDRSFGVKLVSGLRLWERFTASTSLRYRDGQPFTRGLVTYVTDGVDRVPQPRTQMAAWRGASRHTFHMSVDGRLRYDYPSEVGRISLILDGFNLFGSATELLEDSRNGPTFRRALEAVPGRAFLATVEAAF